MFGLGWMEMLIIGAVVMFIAGPTAGPKLFKAVRTMYTAKRDITSGSGLDKLMGVNRAIGTLTGVDEEEDAPDDEG